MGRDITPEKGFVIEVSELISLFLPLDLEDIRSRVITMYRARMDDVLAPDNLRSFEDPEDFKAWQELMQKYVQQLTSAEDMESVARVIEGMIAERLTEMNSEKDDGYFDPYADPYRSIFLEPEDGDYLEDSAEFMLICCFSQIVLQLEPAEVCIFNDYRRNWNVPHRKPCLSFRFEDCFEVQMTAAGRQLAQALGRAQIFPHEWVCEC